MSRDLNFLNLLSTLRVWVVLKGKRQMSRECLFTDQCSSGFSYVDNSIACHEDSGKSERCHAVSVVVLLASQLPNYTRRFPPQGH
jgi:hypothetical protein